MLKRYSKQFTKTRWLLPFIALLWLLPSASWSLPLSDVGYDPLFQRHWPRFVPQHDWRWAKAQAYQESLLEPRAVSPAGAMGLAQFMPVTHQECVTRLRLPARSSPFNPQISTLCQAWYMSVQIRIWTSPRPKLERLNLAFGSYNAGAGNLIKAQRLCNMASTWTGIVECLVQVTGIRNSTETRVYVSRVSKWYNSLARFDERATLPTRADVQGSDKTAIRGCIP